MALPRQVEQDLKEIEELERQMQAPPKPQAVEEEEGQETVAEEVEAQPPKAPVKEEKPQLKAVEDPEDDFKQKYSTLKGKYDAEVPRLHTQVKELMSQVSELRDALTAKQEEVKEVKASLVTDADREAFGEDLIDVQRRVAQEVSSKYEAQIAKLEQTITKLQGQYGEMSFEQKLNQLVPDFQSVNSDSRWVAWLNEYDPLIRGPRRTMAQQAFERGDAEAVADYVKLFKSTLEIVDQSARQAELEKQVAPTRTATTSSVPKDSGKKLYSEAEADRAWTKIRELNSSGRYDEANKLEAEISAAYVEGRVR